MSRRPSRARPRVISSAYSRSPPTGRPLAIRVTRSPSGLSSRARYIAVASPSMFGLVARITSLTPSSFTRARSSLILSCSGPMPSIVAAVDAQLALGEVEAAPAPAHALLRLDDGARETVGVLGRGLQQVEGDALRRFGADAGEPSQLVDQALHRPFEGGCHLVSAERAAEARGEPAEIDATRDRAHPFGLELLGSSHRLADRRHDQILEHLHVVGVDHV